MTDITKLIATEAAPIASLTHACMPPLVWVPLTQTREGACKAVIEAGSTVSEGQIIARLADSSESAVTASVPGEALGFYNVQGADGRYTRAVCIRLEGAFSFSGKKQTEKDISLFSPTQISRIIADSGVINTFDKPASPAREIQSLGQAPLICVRLFDSDPSIATDRSIFLHMTDELAKGLNLTARAASAEKIALVFYEEDRERVNRLDAGLFASEVSLIAVSKKKYPAGTRRELMRLLEREGHPADPANVLFIDSLTLYRIYRAVALGIPTTESIVYAGGGAVHRGGLFSLKVGTPLAQLAQECGGFSKLPARIVVNGLIQGTSLSSLEAGIAKTTKSIHFLSAGETRDQRAQDCLFCGDCRSVCPEGLAPDLLYAHLAGGQRTSELQLASSRLCTDCALCSAVCPARLPLAQAVSRIREESYGA